MEPKLPNTVNIFQTRRSANTVQFKRQVQSGAANEFVLFVLRWLENCVSCMCQAAVGYKKIFIGVRGKDGWVGWDCCMSVSPKVTTTLSNLGVAFNGEEPRTTET